MSTTYSYNKTAPAGPPGAVYLADGSKENLSGAAAPATLDASYRRQNPIGSLLDAYVPGAPSNDISWRAGAWMRRFADNPNPTALGRILNAGPVPGALALGAGGAVAGALAGTLIDKLRREKKNRGRKYALAGLLGLGALGAYSGYRRTKQASVMYSDPRNFILEKLQGASDVSMVEKAKLAASVRNMRLDEATRLAAAVRAAMGFGVGALIAKFLFGSRGMGTLAGGLAGIIGSTLLASVLPRYTSPAIIGQKKNYY